MYRMSDDEITYFYNIIKYLLKKCFQSNLTLGTYLSVHDIRNLYNINIFMENVRHPLMILKVMRDEMRINITRESHQIVVNTINLYLYR